MSDHKSPAESATPGGPTGPRTEAGKARSARNSLKHGLTSRELFVPPGELDNFVDFKATLVEEIQPKGALQMAAFNHLLHAAWTLDHIRAMEAGYLALGPDALESKETRHGLDLVLRYLARHERSYYRARKELEELQTAEAARGTIPPDILQIVPP
ncbi:MAG: hypothetical protein KIT09_35995, partial [Bryobacteraceae bacterium]|nr:hypothetical protein [Bryobacteraceae bacterium]